MDALRNVQLISISKVGYQQALTASSKLHSAKYKWMLYATYAPKAAVGTRSSHEIR